jgi:spermidine/putrescine-binding protein
VSNVTCMAEMFAWSVAFNQRLDKWDVGNVKNMTKMFRDAKKFNQSLNEWNVATVAQRNLMFYNASAFDRSHIPDYWTNLKNHTSILSTLVNGY